MKPELTNEWEKNLREEVAGSMKSIEAVEHLVDFVHGMRFETYDLGLKEGIEIGESSNRLVGSEILASLLDEVQKAKTNSGTDHYQNGWNDALLKVSALIKEKMKP